MRKTEKVNFRLTHEEKLMFDKIADALIVEGEPYNLSVVFRRILEDEYTMLRKKGLISGGIYE